MKREKRININWLNARDNAAESGKIPDKKSVCEPAMKDIVGIPACDKVTDNSEKKSAGTSGKDIKGTIIKRIFSREFNSPKLYMLREEFTTDLKLNAKGRVCIRAALFFISIMYFIDDNATYMSALTLISLLWLTVPLALTLAAPFAQKMVEDRYNLYDILAGIGTFVTAAFPLILGEFLLMRFFSGEYREFFAGLNAVNGSAIFAAITMLITDMISMRKDSEKSQPDK